MLLPFCSWGQNDEAFKLYDQGVSPSIEGVISSKTVMLRASKIYFESKSSANDDSLRINLSSGFGRPFSYYKRGDDFQRYQSFDFASNQSIAEKLINYCQLKVDGIFAYGSQSVQRKKYEKFDTKETIDFYTKKCAEDLKDVFPLYIEARLDQDRRKAGIQQGNLRAEDIKVKAAQDRNEAVKSGQTEPKSYADLVSIYGEEASENSLRILAQPKISPDGNVYIFHATIEKVESRNVFLALTSNSNQAVMAMMGVSSRIDKYYSINEVPSKLLQKYESNARINSEVLIAGKYIGNITYKTIGGETKTAPKFLVEHIIF